MTITEAQYREILRRVLDIQLQVENHSGDFLTDDDIEPILEIMEEVGKQNAGAK